MGFWSNLFGKKQPAKKKVAWPSRKSAAVARLARKRGCSVYDLDLYDDSIIEELLLLGLILSDNGLYYEDDPNWVDETVVDDQIDNIEAVEDAGTFVVATQTVEEALPEFAPVEEKPLPPPPPPPPPVYTPPAPPPEPEPERSRWSSEPSESSWSSSSDSGGWSSDSGGSDFGGGGSDD